MIKVVHIATRITGGAGIAALRLHEGLSATEKIDSKIIQKEVLNENDKNLQIYRCTHFHSLPYRIKNKLNLLPVFNKKEKWGKIIAREEQNYEIATLPFSYFPVEEHPIIKSADIIHLHWVSGFLNYPSFFSKIKQPIVWTLHDMNPFLGMFHYMGDTINAKGTALGELDLRVLKSKLHFLHAKNNIHIACPSKWMMEQSMKSQLLGRYFHSHIPYGLDFGGYSLKDKIEQKKALSLDPTFKTLFFIADQITNPRKGCDIFKYAVDLLPKDIKFNLITVGNNKIKFGINVIKHIHYDKISDRDKINSLYTAADLTVLPSREDNLPNVMLESFANGTPVISFPNGGMKEHIAKQRGILVNGINPEALANGLKAFLEGSIKFDRQDIYQYAIDNFSSDIESKNYMELYKQILSRNSL